MQCNRRLPRHKPGHLRPAALCHCHLSNCTTAQPTWVERLVILHQLAAVPCGVHHQAAGHLAAALQRHSGAAVAVRHVLGLRAGRGQLPVRLLQGAPTLANSCWATCGRTAAEQGLPQAASMPTGHPGRRLACSSRPGIIARPSPPHLAAVECDARCHAALQQAALELGAVHTAVGPCQVPDSTGHAGAGGGTVSSSRDLRQLQPGNASAAGARACHFQAARQQPWQAAPAPPACCPAAAAPQRQPLPASRIQRAPLTARRRPRS